MMKFRNCFFMNTVCHPDLFDYRVTSTNRRKANADFDDIFNTESCSFPFVRIR